MMNTMSSALHRRIAAAYKPCTTSIQYRQTVTNLLRDVIPFDAYCFTTVDPQTLLSTGAVAEDGVEAIHHALFINEYQGEDFNKYRAMIHNRETSAVLSISTMGNLSLSSRYASILQPAGFEDELRAVLVTHGFCWGYLSLFRHAGKAWFTEAEREQLEECTSDIAKALRDYYLRIPVIDAATLKVAERGILILSENLEIMWQNSSAEEWISLLQAAGELDANILPHAIRAVSTDIQRAAAHDEPLSKTCVSLPGGIYLIIQASLITNKSMEQQIAVWIEPAPLHEVLPLMIQTHGLSGREAEILELILQGYSTKDIASALHISAYTVQDHLKSIFTKTGMNSRRELLQHFIGRFRKTEKG
ncbi:helix-turn-helix transcriptional regulator [Neobacillus mesonae]|nr:helix-turn-helix transcriptional regulator [Neobacillus mesonae]